MQSDDGTQEAQNPRKRDRSHVSSEGPNVTDLLDMGEMETISLDQPTGRGQDQVGLAESIGRMFRGDDSERPLRLPETSSGRTASRRNSTAVEKYETYDLYKAMKQSRDACKKKREQTVAVSQPGRTGHTDVHESEFAAMGEFGESGS
ncbi:unnamed protein product [Cyprideis torosa]|uniref:Uncharacterized protein n=1 Tax=Cyprideis torosa TaxID=163714 RepID=A0A7R8W3D8_9CRUS|nr:unnamed protein product [Cyprideis torosa]CAG0882930.1 unnamed protein product [Cyprideis torosa]